MKMYTVSDLLAMPPETKEQAYRRAYRDGFMAALQAAYGERPIPQELWDFWAAALLAWQQKAEGEGADTFERPPSFDADTK